MLIIRAVAFIFIFLSLITLPSKAELNLNLSKTYLLDSKNKQQAIYTVEYRKLDPRAKILADYLASYNSPLQYHAQDFVDAADTFSVDWKLVPSIAGVESTFGKFIPGGYNAWGWGVYGDQALGFKSWRDGIYTVTGGLKKNYIDKGLTNPYTINKVYAASPTWGTHVTYFLGNLDTYAQKHPVDEVAPAESLQTKIAGSSAQLAYNND